MLSAHVKILISVSQFYMYVCDKSKNKNYLISPATTETKSLLFACLSSDGQRNVYVDINDFDIRFEVIGRHLDQEQESHIDWGYVYVRLRQNATI